MKVFFQINYCTVWGQDVRVRICQKDKMEVVLPLSTTDGKKWKGELTVSGDISYRYLIFSNEEVCRAEWNINERRIHDDGSGRSFFMEDAWRDKDDFSCFYSSAFTDCVRRAEAKKVGKTEAQKDVKSDEPLSDIPYKHAIVMHVAAPQLCAGEALCLCGNQKILGNWDVEKGMRMEKDENLLEWRAVLDAKKVEFPLEYKFYAYDKATGKMVDWENHNNHTLEDIREEKNEAYVLSDLHVYFPRPLWKAAGTAIPVFSLRTKGSFGVGDFVDLKKMIDWIVLTHQRILQLLPLNDTTITHTWTDSYPYCSISIYALHPMYLNLARLGKLKDAKAMEHFEELQEELNALPQMDYERVNKGKWEYIRLMFAQEGKRVLRTAGFKTFFADNKYWLMPYAAFSHLRDKFGTPDFRQWGSFGVYNKETIEHLCAPDSEVYDDIALYYYLQYNLHIQLLEASEYARRNHVILKGDIPIGISRNSVEAWTEPFYFNMNGQAGAPPDDFSVKGQNWGFPTYNWNEMAKDGYLWWTNRFKRMAQYFDAYRIDHILGFFRIWEIPSNSVHGLLGQFSPAMPMSVDEIQRYGLSFREDLFTRPFITDYVVDRIFGGHAAKVKAAYLRRTHDDRYEMLPDYDTQRKVESAFYGKTDSESNWIREGLYALISDVLFVRDRKNPNMYHPRIAVQFDFVFEALGWSEKEAFNRLYNDYYYRRHNDFWYKEAMKKLPKLIGSTRMLVCGEDLGMVPDCVETVMQEQHILSLELQRMPKKPENLFGHVSEYPYYSVCTFSSHDTSTLRGWWHEDLGKTARFFNEELHQQGEVPPEAPGWACEMIVNLQLQSTSMLSILTLQDWLSMDEAVRNPDVDGERINVPANPHHYWRYRMHLSLEELMKCKPVNEKITRMIDNSGR
jgi:4-alpha-glucanotransferase